MGTIISFSGTELSIRMCTTHTQRSLDRLVLVISIEVRVIPLQIVADSETGLDQLAVYDDGERVLCGVK